MLAFFLLVTASLVAKGQSSRGLKVLAIPLKKINFLSLSVFFFFCMHNLFLFFIASATVHSTTVPGNSILMGVGNGGQTGKLARAGAPIALFSCGFILFDVECC